MNKIVSTIGDKKYLSDLSNNTIFEISDYTDISNEKLIVIGIINGCTESHIAGISRDYPNKQFGCINYDGNVVVPFCYDNIVFESGLIRATKYDNSNLLTASRYFYFDLDGVPISKETRTKYWGWEWVEDFDKSFSIAQKDSKQGLIRKDGSIFLEPEYKLVEIRDDIPLITAICENNDHIHFLFNIERKKWQRLPINDKVIQKEYDLYLVKHDNLFYTLNLSLEIVIPWHFENIVIGKEYCVVTKQGKKGLFSRSKTVIINNHKIFQPLLPVQYDDIYSFWNKKFIIIKDNKQGIYDLSEERVIVNPNIPIDYIILKDCISNEALGYYNRDLHEYGYFDITGKHLFKIDLPNDEHLQLRPFRNNIAIVEGDRHMYIFNKKGIFTKEKIHRSYLNYHNYDAERWDALTDGMYGDYPGPGVDYDNWGF